MPVYYFLSTTKQNSQVLNIFWVVLIKKTVIVLIWGEHQCVDPREHNHPRVYNFRCSPYMKAIITLYIIVLYRISLHLDILIPFILFHFSLNWLAILFMYFDLLTSKHYWIILIYLSFQSFWHLTYLITVIPGTSRTYYIGCVRFLLQATNQQEGCTRIINLRKII